MRANVSSPRSSNRRKPLASSTAKISGALNFIASRWRPMRTKGSTGSCAAGESMTTAVLDARVRRKYFRNEASPASRRSSASRQPESATKSARIWARSGTEPLLAVDRGEPTFTVDRKRHDQAVLGQEPTQPLRPFHERDAVGAGLLPAELEDLVGRFEAIEIEMPEGALRRVVDLDQRESRAGHDQPGIARNSAQDGTGKRRLAGAQAALQRHEVAGPQAPGQGGAQPLGGGFIRQGQRKSRHLSMPTFSTRPPSLALWAIEGRLALSSGRDRP